MKCAIAFTIAALLLFITACQPTPESPIVIGKDNERMIEQAQETLAPEIEKLPLTERYAIKEHVTKEISKLDGKLVINVDADVAVPNTDALSITHVVPADFSQDTVSSLFNALCGDTVMYTERRDFTKAEIEEYLLMLRQERETAEASSASDRARLEADKTIAFYEEMYADAPETAEDVVCDGTLFSEAQYFSDVYAGNATRVSAFEHSAQAELLFKKGGVGKVFAVYNNRDLEDAFEAGGHTYYPDYQATIQYYDGRHYDGNWDCYWNSERTRITSSADLTEDEVAASGISPEEAVALVENLFAQVQIPFTVQDILYIAADEPFYELSCSRQVNGANLTIGGEGVGGDGVAPYWSYERLHVWVSSQGIVYFNWISPCEVLETEVANATLLPFEDIEAIFYQMMGTIYAPVTKDQNAMTIKVSKVALQLQRIQYTSDNTEGLLTPVWCFYGTKFIDEAVKNEGMMADWERGYMELLTINAVDGSIIDLAKGY